MLIKSRFYLRNSIICVIFALVRMRFQDNATKLTLFHDTTKFSLSISRNLK